MTRRGKYSDVRVGDLVWNPYGYTGRRGHWTRVTAIKNDGRVVILSVSDGYQEYGNADENVGFKR